MITPDLKQKVVSSLAEARKHFGGTDAKFAVSIGINNAQYSRIKNGDTDKVLSDANWISLARKLNISLDNAPDWKTANTPTFQFIMGQLEFCQKQAASRLLCDVPDIGKTYSAKYYASRTRNTVYVDCSQVKQKQKMVRYIAKGFGVGHTGRYSDVYADLVFYIRSLPRPLIILDEAGDLEYQAFLELKALWNATEGACGWYMMGADGLREKIRRSMEFKKVGYAEIFSRYGNRYQQASPDSGNELREFKSVHAAMIIKANAPNLPNMQQVITKSDYSLRRIYHELRKLETQTA